MGERHDLYRHGLRVRRQADRAAVSRARAGQRSGPAGVLRAGPAARARHAGGREAASTLTEATCSTSTTCRQAHRSDAATAARSPSGRRTRLAALEVMSRFAIDPRWLIYLPPTMPRCHDGESGICSSTRTEALAAYREEGCRGRVRGEAHGLARGRRRSAATRTRPATVRRVGEVGAIYTRTGRPFFDPAAPSRLVPGHRRDHREPVYGTSCTDWVVLDCELMPWSAKAQELLRNQYAPVGAAAMAGCRMRLCALLERGGRSRTRCCRLASAISVVGAAKRPGVHRRLSAVLLAGGGAGGSRAGAVPRCSRPKAPSTPTRTHLWHLDAAVAWSRAAIQA